MECSFSPKFRSSIRPSTNSRSGLQLVRRYSRTVQSSSELGSVAMGTVCSELDGKPKPKLAYETGRDRENWTPLLSSGTLVLFVLVIAVFFPGDGDAQGTKEVKIVLGERTFFICFQASFGIGVVFRSEE